jgi:hypothetical protein
LRRCSNDFAVTTGVISGDQSSRPRRRNRQAATEYTDNTGIGG